MSHATRKKEQKKALNVLRNNVPESQKIRLKGKNGFRNLVAKK